MNLKELRARHAAQEARFCTGSRAIEWILVASSFWAAVVMTWTPTILRQNPPPFYQAIRSFVDSWVIGCCILVVCLVHGAGLLSSRCPGRRGDDGGGSPVPCAQSPVCRQRRIGAFLRQIGAFGQVGVWVFLVSLYAALWFQLGQLTLGSGVCVIFAVCASATSHCTSKERARLTVRGEIADMALQTQSSGEMLARLKGMK